MSQPPGSGRDVPPGLPGPYGQGPSWTVPVLQQAPRPPSPRRWLSVTVIVLGLGVVFGATFLVGRLTAPRATPAASTTTTRSPAATMTSAPTSASTPPVPRGTPTKGFTYDGASLAGPNFTASLPSGWAVGSSNGSDNDGAAEGPVGRVYYYGGGTFPAATLCTNILTTLRAAPADVATDVSGVRWGTLATVAKNLTTTNKDASGKVTGEPVAFTVYCVDLPTGASSLLVAVSTPADHENNKAAVAQLLTSWVWR